MKKNSLLVEVWSVKFYRQRTFHPVRPTSPLKSPEWVNGIDLKGKTVFPSQTDLLYLALSSARADHNIQTSVSSLSCSISTVHLPFRWPSSLSKRFALPPAYLYHKDERVQSENLQISECLSPCNNAVSHPALFPVPVPTARLLMRPSGHRFVTIKPLPLKATKLCS